MAEKNELKKAINEMAAVAPEFAKLTQDLLFGDIWEREGLSLRSLGRAGEGTGAEGNA